MSTSGMGEETIGRKKMGTSVSADLKSYLDLLQERVVVTDIDGSIIFKNKVAKRDTGNANTEIEPALWSSHFQIREATNDKPLSTNQLPIMQVLATGREHQKKMAITFNGKARYINVHARPRFSDKNVLIGCIATYTDITTEILQQQRLQLNESRLKTLLERINEGVMQVDITGKVQFVNNTFCHIVGHNRKSLIGRNIVDVLQFGPNGKAKAEQRIIDARNGLSERYEINIVTGKGEPKIIEVSGEPIKDEKGTVTGILSIHMDVTQRKMADEMLRQNEAQYRNLVEHMNEGVVLVNDSGTILFANKRFGKLIGKKADTLAGVSYVALLGLDGMPNKTGHEVAIKNHRGQIRWHHVSVAKHPVKSTTGDAILLIHNDVTEGKQLAEERERLLLSVESTSDFVAMIKMDGTILYINPSCRKRLGIPQKRPANQVSMAEHYTPKGLKKLTNEAVPYAIKHGIWQGELDVLDKNKKTIPLSQVIIAKRGKNGKVEYFTSMARDITESRKIQREMAILARMPHEQPSPMMRIARNGTITYANPASEVLLKEWKTKTNQKVPASWQKTVTRVLRTGEIIDTELQSKNHIFEIKLVPINEYEYVNLIGADITARKLAEDKLKASEQKYRAVVEDQTELISRYLADGTITFANKAYCKYFNHNPDTIIGKNIFELIPDYALDSFKYKLSTLSKKKPSITYSQEIKDTKSNTRWQMWTDRALYDERGHFIEYQSVARDITDLMRTEHELRMQEMYLRQIIDSLPNFVFVRNGKGYYTLVNKAFADFLGKDIKAIIGKKQGEAIPSFELEERFAIEDKTVITSQKGLTIAEERVFNPIDQREYWFNTVKKPIPGVDGSTQVLGVSTDITPRKNIETWLQLQLSLKEHISNISTRFINLPFHQIDGAITESLKTLGELNGVDRAVVHLKTGAYFAPNYYWFKNNNKADQEVVYSQHLFNPDMWEALAILNQGYLFVEDTDLLPKEAYLQDFVKRATIKSVIVLPLQSKGDIIGALSLATTREKLVLKKDVIALLRIASQIFASAIERKNTSALLNFTLQFENIITIISANFINISPKNIPAEIDSSLRYIAQFLEIDQGYVLMANTTGRRFKLINYWLEDGLKPSDDLVKVVEGKKYLWIHRQVKKHGYVQAANTHILPEEASDIKELMELGGVKSFLGIPIMTKSVFRGLLIFGSFQKERFWQMEALPLLRIYSQIIANALERKQQEEELAETRELYRTLARNIPKMAVFLYDRDLRFKLVEGAELENQGYDKASIEGRTLAQVLPPANRKLMEPLYRNALNGQEHIMEREFNKKQYLIHFLPVKNDTGEIYAGMVMSLDISDLKENQRKLEQQATELKRSNEDLELFAYAASHDLQEPLRMISSYVHLIKRRLESQLDSETTEFMAFATDGVKRMQQLINDLLEYSRVDRKGNNFVKLDMNKTVDFVKINLQQKIRETNATIEVAKLPVIEADQPQMISLLQNLIENALKFHSAEPPLVKIGYAETKSCYRFHISDNGIGIAKKYFDRIFIIFQRLNSRNDYTGTGIGLAICKKIVERHGGKLWVESEQGKGTTFYFDIAKNKENVGRMA